MQRRRAFYARRQRHRDWIDGHLPASPDVLQGQVNSRRFGEGADLELHHVLQTGGQPLPDIDVALADGRFGHRLVDGCLDAPVAGVGRNPDDAAHRRAAGRNHHRGHAHRMEEHADAEIRHTEFEFDGVRVDRIGVDHLRTEVCRLACNGRRRVHGDFVLRVPGPVATGEGHRPGLGRKCSVLKLTYVLFGDFHRHHS